MAVTLRSIAEEVKVSPSTVSRVLNGQPGISAALAERVLTAATAMGYRYKNQARLGSGRILRRVSLVVGGSVGLVARPFYASLFAGASTEGEAVGMGITFATVNTDAAVGRLVALGTDGLIVGGQLPPDRLRALVDLGLPCVVANDRATGDRTSQPALDRVVFDDAEVGRLAATELLGGGATRFAVFHQSLLYEVARVRVDSFRATVTETLPDAIIETYEVPRINSLPDANASADLAERLFRLPEEKPNGIFCTATPITGGVLRGLRRAGVAVPATVALVGYGDSEAAEVSSPPLTVVRGDPQALGRAALRRLLERAREPAEPPVMVVLGVELVRRESVRLVNSGLVTA